MTLMPGAIAADVVDQLPELAARQRIDAGRRLVEDQEIGVVNQRAAEAELLLHAPRELAGRPIREGAKPVLCRSSPMRRLRSRASWPNSRPKKSTFSKTESVG